MVDDVTEKDKSLPWMERKMKALEHIKYMQKDSLLVKSADVLHNLTDLNKDIEIEGEKVFQKFNASKENTILRYKKLISEIEETWKANPLIGDLQSSLEKLISLTN